jgi:hypothetical protein
MIDAIGQLFVGSTISGISAPIEGSGSPGWMSLVQMKSMLSDILSKNHFIESNGKEK